MHQLQLRKEFMSEVFFIFENITYRYDIDTCKLYELADDNSVEVKNHHIFRSVRFHATEISRETALKRQAIEPETTSCYQTWPSSCSSRPLSSMF